MMDLRTGTLSLTLWASALVHAQEHPFLSLFDITEGDGQVFLDWTIESGNTCDGTRILRSLDSLDLQEIGSISGLCGSISAPTYFRHVDTDPPELTTVYYRLQLGTNGFSSIQRIDLKRLFTAEHRVFPSPMLDNGTLLLRVDPETRVVLRIWSATGRLVHDATGRGGRLDVPAATWPAGVYIYEASAEGRKISGRFVVI